MYYYEIQDVNGSVVHQCPESYHTGEEATNAAKDDLATRIGFVDFPVEIRISDKPFYEEPRYFSSTYYMDEEMVRQHARKRIDEANRAEFVKFVHEALDKHDLAKGQYDRGLITPLEFVKSEESAWLQARFSIESMEGYK